jgi:hypothetical protein
MLLWIWGRATLAIVESSVTSTAASIIEAVVKVRFAESLLPAESASPRGAEVFVAAVVAAIPVSPNSAGDVSGYPFVRKRRVAKRQDA